MNLRLPRGSGLEKLGDGTAVGRLFYWHFSCFRGLVAFYLNKKYGKTRYVVRCTGLFYPMFLCFNNLFLMYLHGAKK